MSKKIVLTIVLTVLITVGLTALLVNIFERKNEARNPFFRVVELTDNTEDPAIWGKNFPLQYDLYRRTVDQQRTRYGGSEALPHNPSNVDPRHVVSQNKLEEDPRLKAMWAGYPFSVDFREERGHAYMLDDQRSTRRVVEFKQPGTCLNCHASTYVTMKNLGGGDIFQGFEKLNHMTYGEATKLAKHPVACIDCHDPATMQLRVTRPGFIEGIRALKDRRASRTTIPTPRHRRRRCAPSCVDSATSNTISKVRKSGLLIRGQRVFAWRTSWPTTRRSNTPTGCTPTPAPPC
jgi:nitrite reductase (cytochrome c-552)